MRPLPQSKTHGVVTSISVTRENLEQVAEQLKIPKQNMKRLRPGDHLHIVREAQELELDRNAK